MNQAAKEWLKVYLKLVMDERSIRPHGRTIHSLDLDPDIAQYGDEIAHALFSEIEATWKNSVSSQHLGPAGGTHYRIHFHVDLPLHG